MKVDGYGIETQSATDLWSNTKKTLIEQEKAGKQSDEDTSWEGCLKIIGPCCTYKMKGEKQLGRRRRHT